jgi:hypothetical protein
VALELGTLNGGRWWGTAKQAKRKGDEARGGRKTGKRKPGPPGGGSTNGRTGPVGRREHTKSLRGSRTLRWSDPGAALAVLFNLPTDNVREELDSRVPQSHLHATVALGFLNVPAHGRGSIKKSRTLAREALVGDEALSIKNLRCNAVY